MMKKKIYESKTKKSCNDKINSKLNLSFNTN